MECTLLHGSQLSQSDSVELVLPETHSVEYPVNRMVNDTNERNEPVRFVRPKESFIRTGSRTNEPTLLTVSDEDGIGLVSERKIIRFNISKMVNACCLCIFCLMPD